MHGSDLLLSPTPESREATISGRNVGIIWKADSGVGHDDDHDHDAEYDDDVDDDGGGADDTDRDGGQASFATSSS